MNVRAKQLHSQWPWYRGVKTASRLQWRRGHGEPSGCHTVNSSTSILYVDVDRAASILLDFFVHWQLG